MIAGRDERALIYLIVISLFEKQMVAQPATSNMLSMFVLLTKRRLIIGKRRREITRVVP